MTFYACRIKIILLRIDWNATFLEQQQKKLPFDFWSIDDNHFFLQRLINNQSIKYMTEPSNKEMIEIISREWIMSHSPIMKYTIIQAWKKKIVGGFFQWSWEETSLSSSNGQQKYSFFFVFVLEVWGRFWLSCYSNFLQENKKVKHLNHVSSSEVNFRFNFWHYYGYY